MTMASNDMKDKVAEKTNQAFVDVKDKGNDVISSLKSATSDVANKASDVAHQAGKNINEVAHTLSDKVFSASESVAAEIRRKPVQSAFIALAIGVIGTLFYRRSA